MIHPSRALKLASAPPLPMPPELAPLQQDYGLTFRRGQLQMVVGRSGSMKSMFAMWYAWRCGLNTLYFSADQTVFHFITRLGSLMTEDSVRQVEEALNAGAEELYSQAFGSSRMEFVFDSAPTLDTFSAELSAYVENRDAYPDLIVVDTLNNVDAERDDKYGGLTLLEQEFHRMARETGAGILVVHHTKQDTDKHKPQGKSSIDGKVDKLFEYIVTVALNPNNMEFMMAVVKNRGGKCDAMADTWFSLKAEPEYARFAPFIHGGW